MTIGEAGACRRFRRRFEVPLSDTRHCIHDGLINFAHLETPATLLEVLSDKSDDLALIYIEADSTPSIATAHFLANALRTDASFLVLIVAEVFDVQWEQLIAQLRRSERVFAVETFTKLISSHQQMLDEMVAAPELRRHWKYARRSQDLDYFLEAAPGALQRAIEGLEQVSDLVSSLEDVAPRTHRRDKSPADLHRAVEDAVAHYRTLTADQASVCREADLTSRQLPYPERLAKLDAMVSSAGHELNNTAAVFNSLVYALDQHARRGCAPTREEIEDLKWVAERLAMHGRQLLKVGHPRGQISEDVEPRQQDEDDVDASLEEDTITTPDPPRTLP